MIGLWYDYYQYPESWYYLPCLLVVILVQLLGFILLQIYLYVYSKSRRKTTLCGLCFMHKSTEIPQGQQLIQQKSLTGLRGSESLYRINHNHNHNHNSSVRTDLNIPQSLTNLNRQQSNTLLNSYPSIDNINYTKSLPKRVHNDSGIYDPIFGEQIIQSAVPIQSRNHRNKHQQFVEMNKSKQKSLSELTTSNNYDIQSRISKQLNETQHKQFDSFENHVNLRKKPLSSSERLISHRNQSTNKLLLQSQEIPSSIVTNTNVQCLSDNMIQSTVKNSNSRKTNKNVNRHHHHHQHHQGIRTSHRNSDTVSSRTIERHYTTHKE